MNLKQMVMTGICALTLFAGENLMAWGGGHSRRNIFGGYDYYNSNGSSAGYSRRNIFGGHDFYNSNGSSAGHSRRNIFGGYDYYRGQKETAEKLFKDPDFVKRIDTGAIQDALVAKNVDALTSCAWDLKGLEIVLGKKDTKTTSDMLFNAAAQIAVDQGNGDALKQIIALAPECKKYEAQLAMKSKTRGTNKSVCALPQLCLLPSKDYKKAIGSLTMWQQPMLGDYICASFRGMSKQSADIASMLVNEGRITMNPQMIAMGALELSKYSYNSELGIKFEPAQIFAEAVELAIVKQDKAALTQLAALYNTASFKSEECAKHIQNELAMLSGMRGMKPNAKCTPGDFGPADFHKLIRTVYFEDACEQVK